MFVTVPLNTNICPGAGGTTGHVLVSASRGVLVTAQVRVTLAVTTPPQRVVP